MRIAVINWTNRRAGGVESYLNNIIPELIHAGHQVAFWFEVDKPLNRERITLPDGVYRLSVDELGAGNALAALRDWQPDLIYAHGLVNPELEAATLHIAPGVFFAHSYYGTCISGSKTFKRPVVKPCERRFGWRCLVQYYPHRCGGLSPVTMIREYLRQSARLELLHDYEAIVTASSYIQSELLEHGLEANSVYKFPYYVRESSKTLSNNGKDSSTAPNPRTLPIFGQDDPEEFSFASRSNRRLLFLGRMDVLKGGGVMLDALPLVSESLGLPLHVTFAGDGPARRSWQRRASRLQSKNQNLYVEFTGWIGGERIDSLLSECDLLVLPSLWPEPFGLVGPEAGLRGVPIAAFSVGGIPDWLVDGVNGRLAPGNPPTVDGLAAAITNCLRDSVVHAAMKRAAVSLAQKYSMKNHLGALLEVFEGVVHISANAR
jgi:glycosyltransferase involved in cell wall biosynthesis